MKRFVLALGIVALTVCVFSVAAFAAVPVQGFPRSARVTVETRYKAPLMELVLRTFESEGYRARRRTEVELIMERPLPSALRWTLVQMKGKYWGPADPVRYGVSPSVERVVLSVVRTAGDEVSLSGHRILVMSPGTVFEGGFADESRDRAEELRAVLERIRGEAEATEEARRRADPYFLLISPDIR